MASKSFFCFFCIYIVASFCVSKGNVTHEQMRPNVETRAFFCFCNKTSSDWSNVQLMRIKKKKRPKLVSFLNNETFQNCLLKSLLKEKEHQKPQRELPNFLATKKTKRLVFTPSSKKSFRFWNRQRTCWERQTRKTNFFASLEFCWSKSCFRFFVCFWDLMYK